MTRLLKLSPAVTGAIFMVLSGILYSVSNALVQYGGMMMNLAPTKIAFWEYFIALLFSVPWLLSRDRSAFRTKHIFAQIVRIAFAVGGVQFFVIGLANVPIWQAMALMLLSPFFVTIGAGPFLKEKVGLDRWGAAIVAFIGGMIVLAPWSGYFSIYALYPVGAAICWAVWSLMTKHLSKSDSPETMTIYLLLLLTPVNAIMVLKSGASFGFEIGREGLLLLAIGLLTGFAQFCLSQAYARADAAYLQPFDNVKLPFSILLGMLWFGFFPPGSLWIGAIFILGASYFLLREERAKL